MIQSPVKLRHRNLHVRINLVSSHLLTHRTPSTSKRAIHSTKIILDSLWECLWHAVAPLAAGTRRRCSRLLQQKCAHTSALMQECYAVSYGFSVATGCRAGTSTIYSIILIVLLFRFITARRCCKLRNAVTFMAQFCPSLCLSVCLSVSHFVEMRNHKRDVS